jgi:hypothetical protein
MIFFSHKCGQLGNRLFVFGHFIANAAEYNGSISNLSFDEYSKHFETTSQDALVRYPAVKSMFRSDWLRSFLLFINRVTLKLLRKFRFNSSPFHSIITAEMPEYQFGNDRYFELDDAQFQRTLQRKPVVFLFGRFFRDFKNFEKHQDLIRAFFKPTAPVQAMIDRAVQIARHNADIVVGVHIRRGDYKEFAAGKFFYAHEEYRLKMKELEISSPGKRIRFLICSNEEVDLKAFQDVSCCTGPGHLVGDMYALAQCDFIMGPPSTYSLWASFYGRKPLYQIRDLGKSFSFDDFVIFPPRILYNLV